jgi:type IV secretory pathway TrbF-like protein
MMKMREKFAMGILGMVLAVGLAGAPTRVAAQDKQHVVSLDELNKDASRPAQTRQADEAAVRQLLSSEAGKEALKSAKVDYQRVDKAIGQLSDEDLSKVAERSRTAQRDFAAGGLGSTLIIAIVLIVVLIVVLSLVF